VLQQVSVVIVDEVHERSCENDMLLLLLREYMQLPDAPKLVLMSATGK
jgi:HrpA-like RNA helicase